MAQPRRKHEPQTLTLQRWFAASPERVFDAFTRREAKAAWFGPGTMRCRNLEIDLRVGGGYSLELHGDDGTVHPLAGTYLEIDPPRRLVMTWTWGFGHWEGVETLVTLDLKADQGGTLLEVTHENLDGIEARDAHAGGWNGSLDRLEGVLGGQ